MTYQSSESRTPYVILAALTFDETGVNALREAARIAELHPASQLHVLHVVTEIKTSSSARELLSVERRLEHAPALMRQYVEHIWSKVPRKVIGHLRVGVPSRSILQTAADVNAELVVVGTHRRSGVKKLMLGSVAEQVVQHAHCPVFIAMPKDYSRKADKARPKPRTSTIEPVCAQCAEVRRTSAGEHLWCEQHGRAQAAPRPHRPEPVAPRPVMRRPPPPPPPAPRARTR